MERVDIENLAKIFLPYAWAEREKLKSANIRLAYYTHAETANKIIRHQEFWLRDCQKMNDLREVKHGTDIVDGYLKVDANRQALCNIFDACVPGAAKGALDLFDEWKKARSAQTFLMSFSRHAPPDSILNQLENSHGRLSMWRGYGGIDGVALIFRVPFAQSSNLTVLLSPVAYLDHVDGEVAKVLEAVQRETEFLSKLSSDTLRNMIFFMLVAAATCLKHPGFREEDEWRLLYLPSTFGSPFVREQVVQIAEDGSTETIYKITFADMVRAGIVDANIDTMLERVIVGPSAYPEDIERYLVEALQASGVKNPGARVQKSGIPFRFAKPRVVPV